MNVRECGNTEAIGERIEEYLVECKKAIGTGMREDLPKELIRKLDEQASEWHDKALAIPSSPPQTPRAIGPRPPTTMTTTASSIIATACLKSKKSERKQIKQNEKQPNVEAVVAIDSDNESNSDLVIDEHPEEASN